MKQVSIIMKIPAILVTISLLLGCSEIKDRWKPASDRILVNQVGYFAKASKRVLVKDYEGSYKLLDYSTDRVVAEGKAKPTGIWRHSGENYSEIDISEIEVPGRYYLRLENEEVSHPININNEILLDLGKSALKSYYYNRASFEILPKYGGKWSRGMGHPDTNIIIHASVKNSTLAEGSVISSPGGWYDAGDYNKYIVNSAITVYTLLSAYYLYPTLFDSLQADIPESNNGLPDILNEAMYNIRWMLTMQDSDGGVYHKLTTLRFEKFVMPAEADDQRYVVMKTTPATLDFAASIAACSRILNNVNGAEGLADSCKKAANRAWEWADMNPEVYYKQPEDINTGEYNDTNLSDERMWASVEMYMLTDDDRYLDGDRVFSVGFPFTTPSWDVVNTLGLISIVTNPVRFDKELYSKAQEEYFKLVDDLLSIYTNSPALVSLDYFKWGSNSDVANQAMLAFIAYKLSGEEKYARMALDNMDYLLGRNPTTFCFVSGFGSKSPVNIHHRPSGSDSVPEPIPGMLIGGPNTIVLNDCGQKVVRSGYPALSYVDEECSYSTNEVAINWTAPLIFSVAGSVDYFY